MPDTYDLSSAGVWLCAALVGYCFGCLTMAWIIGFLRGVDIKKSGNGNAGASNAFTTLGAMPGVITALWDISKAILAYLFMDQVFHVSKEACLLAAAFTVIGHCFPFWLYFDGGKGFAPFIGFMLCGCWEAALIPLAIGALAMLITDKIVAITFTCAILWPVLLGLIFGWPYGVCYGVLSLLLILRHRQNIRNLIHGTEPGVRMALRKARKS